MRWLLPLVLILAATLARAGVSTPGTAEFEFGYFCALEPVASAEAKDTISGEILLVDTLPRFIRRGHMVPAQIGVGFGVHVRVRPEHAGPVTIESVHPPMGPNGVTRQSWITTLSDADKSYLGYSFEHRYELLPGTWTFRASASGRLIYEVSFSVVDPGLLPPVSCGWNLPTS